MSWNINAVGKSEKLISVIKSQTDPIKWKCSEPEETIRQKAADLICTALEGQLVGTPVIVNASGSMSIRKYGADNVTPLEFTNSLKIEINPLYGFVE
jgi:hypothetical protein